MTETGGNQGGGQGGNNAGRRAVVGALLGLSLLTATDALALPKEGADAPSAKVTDVDGKTLDPSALKGKPVLIVYEDKDSAKQNQALKDELAKLAKGDKYKTKVAIAAIADVSAFDFWPAKGFVIDALRGEAKKAGIPIYCDWSGTFRKAYGMQRSTSNVVLLDKQGKVLFARSGPLAITDRQKLLGLLQKQVEG